MQRSFRRKLVIGWIPTIFYRQNQVYWHNIRGKSTTTSIKDWKFNISGISRQHLQHFTNVMKCWRHWMRQEGVGLIKCGKLGKTLKDWQTSVITLIFKKEIVKTTNYRGISLLSLPEKMYAKCIERKWWQIVKSKLEDGQCGLRPGRSTTDPIFTLRQIFAKSWEYAKGVFANFVDLDKAIKRKSKKRWNTKKISWNVIFVLRKMRLMFLRFFGSFWKKYLWSLSLNFSGWVFETAKTKPHWPKPLLCGCL